MKSNTDLYYDDLTPPSRPINQQGNTYYRYTSINYSHHSHRPHSFHFSCHFNVVEPKAIITVEDVLAAKLADFYQGKGLCFWSSVWTFFSSKSMQEIKRSEQLSMYVERRG